MSNCVICQKPLQKIGRARKNGKQSHDDWYGRNKHKKCWKEEQQRKLFIDLLKLKK